MLSIVIFGTGNVAHHLIEVFLNKPSLQIVQVFGRNEKALSIYADKGIAVCSNINELKNADCYLLAVSDDSITELSAQLSHKNALMVHTSGSVGIQNIAASRKGVFYPLQTFSKNKPVDFSSIPICVEANSSKDYQLLENLANTVSNSVHRISSKQRKALHLAAVFANNFSNHLFHVAHTICEENEVDFELLKPLIVETVDKIRFLTPKDVQTGPALRGDKETLKKHLDELKNPLQKELYTLISQSIQKTYEEKL